MTNRELAVELRKQHPEYTLQQIGYTLGITRERVRQLLKRAGIQTTGTKRACELSRDLESYIDKSSPIGCWPWLGSLNSRGYGLLSKGKLSSNLQERQAHRAVYISLIGPIPDGMVINHLCWNPSCVNPNHLEVVTPRQNSNYRNPDTCKMRKGGTCVQGHPYNSETVMRVRNGTDHTTRCRKCQREQQRQSNLKWYVVGSPAPCCSTPLTEADYKSIRDYRKCHCCELAYQRDYYRRKHAHKQKSLPVQNA